MKKNLLFLLFLVLSTHAMDSDRESDEDTKVWVPLSQLRLQEARECGDELYCPCCKAWAQHHNSLVFAYLEAYGKNQEKDTSIAALNKHSQHQQEEIYHLKAIIVDLHKKIHDITRQPSAQNNGSNS